MTPTEQRVLDCVCRGMSNKEIARELGMAEGTIKVHCKAIFRRLGVRSRCYAIVKVLTANEAHP